MLACPDDEPNAVGSSTKLSALVADNTFDSAITRSADAMLSTAKPATIIKLLILKKEDGEKEETRGMFGGGWGYYLSARAFGLHL